MSVKLQVDLQEPQRRAQVVNTMQGLYFSLGEFSLDSKAAREEGVKDSATYFQFAWQMQDDELLLGAGLSGLLYKDRREFVQLVEDTHGDEYTADSEAQAVNIFGEVGYAFSPNDHISLDVLGGMEIVLSSERSIAGCSNCYSEDIDLSSGLYFSPRIRVLPNKYFMMGLAYQQYLTGDINGGLMFTIGGRF